MYTDVEVSNGIRFSISDLSGPTARILPTLFQDRSSVSLYDAQFKSGHDKRLPIPQEAQNDVIASFLRFRETCKDFGVPTKNIYVLATEATRTAPNSDEFRAKIKDSTGWDVQMLTKEDEGRIGALGVASSLPSIQGLVMDLGGGSTQITWVSAKNGTMQHSSKGSISFPYGAAALTMKLEKCKKKELLELETEMKTNFRRAYDELDIPQDLRNIASRQGGLDLYLSGGGFRGWGYLLMSQSKVNPYPVPIINGFQVDKEDFHDTATVQSIVSTADSKLFRVSKRRAAQVPAVAFLINVLAAAIPMIKTVHFCQGGVREGYLFDTLPNEIQSQDPLIVASLPHSSPSAHDINSLLLRSLPRSSVEKGPPSGEKYPPPSFTPQFLAAVSNLMYAHSSVPKESRPAAALHTTTTGLLVSAHGLSHANRALLSLVLCDRWPGDIYPSDLPFLQRLRQLIQPQEAWWCRYVGRVAALIGDMYPAGIIRSPARVDFEARWESKGGKKGRKEVLVLTVKVPRSSGPFDNDEILDEHTQGIRKVGKKKNWIKPSEKAGRDLKESWGLKVDVVIQKTL